MKRGLPVVNNAAGLQQCAQMRRAVFQIQERADKNLRAGAINAAVVAGQLRGGRPGQLFKRQRGDVLQHAPRAGERIQAAFGGVDAGRPAVRSPPCSARTECFPPSPAPAFFSPGHRRARREFPPDAPGGVAVGQFQQDHAGHRPREAAARQNVGQFHAVDAALVENRWEMMLTVSSSDCAGCIAR